MKAVQFDARVGQLQMRSVDVPTAAGDDVLVKVAYSGVCGSDLHAMMGTFPCLQTGAFTMGHEFCGTVRAVGEHVTTVKVGDRVAINPKRGCNKCQRCQDGRYQFCENERMKCNMGMWRNGGWADFSLVSEQHVFKIPEGMDLRQASLMEPLSCVVHGWDLVAPLHVGSRVLILGAGIIGNLWSAMLHHQGHRKVTVSEPQQGRRDALRKLGLGYEIISPEQLKAKDPGWLVDLVVDCSGHPPAMEDAFKRLDIAGTLLMFGCSPPGVTMRITPYDIFDKELKITAVNRNPYCCNKALGLIQAMGDRYIDFDKLGVKTFRLGDYKVAIEELGKGTIAKAMFVLDEQFSEPEK